MKTDFSKLPKHWKIKKLKEVVVSQKGKAPIHWFNKKINNALPYLDVEALSTNNFTQFVDWYSTVWIDERDICVLWDGGRNGLILKGKKGALGSTFYGLTPLAIDSDYLFYYLKTKEELRKDTRHVENTFWEMEIPIPPIEEQKHIAQSIQATYQNFETQNKEAEKNLLDSFKKLVPIQSKNLEKIEGLDSFKKAVLDLAVSGKLTEKETDWNHVFLGNITEYITSGSRDWAKYYSKNNEGSFFVRTQDINTNKLDLSKSIKVKLPNKVEGKRSLISKFDILITITGSNYGRSAIVDFDIEDAYVSQSIALVRLQNTNYASFVHLCLLSETVRNQVENLVYGDAQPVLNLEQIRSLSFQLPSLEEQTEIVNIVESIFAEADKIQQDFELQKKQQEDLLKSVINTFFQFSAFPITQTDWDLDAQIKEARERKEKEIKLLKDKQMAFQNTLFNFGKMKTEDKNRIKKKIKEVTYREFISLEFLTEKEIDLLRDSVKGISNKSYDDNDFATVFLEMTQELFDDEKQKEGQKEGNDKPFFESIIINNDTLALKFPK